MNSYTKLCYQFEILLRYIIWSCFYTYDFTYLQKENSYTIKFEWSSFEVITYWFILFEK